MKPFYYFTLNVARAAAKLFFSFKVINQEKIVEDQGAILASNHVSFLDPPLVAISCRKEIHFLARKTLMDWPVFGTAFKHLNVVPVDQERADMSALKTIIKLVRQGKRAIVFPEGARSFDGKIQPAQPGLGLIVAKTLAPVVPMRIFGAYEAFPRGAKGIAMHPIRVVIGDPLYFTEEEIKKDGKEAYKKISEKVVAAIAAIELPEDE